jgi:co-chaperonin GroES (HSP10)
MESNEKDYQIRREAAAASGLPVMDHTFEVQDSRAVSGNKEEPAYVEINGLVAGFTPSYNRVLIKRLPPPPEGLIVRPEVAMEQSERGVVIAIGRNEWCIENSMPIGAIAKFSKYTEEIHFDDEGVDSYVIPYINDIRGWHA